MKEMVDIVSSSCLRHLISCLSIQYIAPVLTQFIFSCTIVLLGSGSGCTPPAKRTERRISSPQPVQSTCQAAPSAWRPLPVSLDDVRHTAALRIATLPTTMIRPFAVTSPNPIRNYPKWTQLYAHLPLEIVLHRRNELLAWNDYPIGVGN